MFWKQTLLDIGRDALAFIAAACAWINLVLLGVFSVWFVSKLLWHLAAYLDDHWFARW